MAVLTAAQREVLWQSVADLFRTQVTTALAVGSETWSASQYDWRIAALSRDLQVTAYLVGRGEGDRRRCTGTVVWLLLDRRSNRVLAEARSWPELQRKLGQAQQVMAMRAAAELAQANRLEALEVLAHALEQRSAVSVARAATDSVVVNATLTEAQARALMELLA